MKYTSVFMALLLWVSAVLSQSFQVGQQTLNWEDNNRNKRPIKTEIWYPCSDSVEIADGQDDLPFILEPTRRNAAPAAGSHPLVLLSHGTGGNRMGLAWLAISLAKTGYIVAAPDHWGNTFDNKIPEYFVRSWERPLDLSFVLTEILAHPIFSTRIDTSKIGAAGFSLGGYTIIALAGGEIDYEALKAFSETPQGKKEFNIPELGDLRKISNTSAIEQGYKQNKHLKDPRIKSFVAMAPALGQGFIQPEHVQQILSPLLIIGAESDQIAPIPTNAKHYHALIKHSDYFLISGEAGHYVFLNEAKDPLKKEAPFAYRDGKSVNRAEIHRLVAEKTINLFNKM